MRVARDSKLNKRFFGQSVESFKSLLKDLVSKFKTPDSFLPFLSDRLLEI